MLMLEFHIGVDRYQADKGGDHRLAIADMTGLAVDFDLGGFVVEHHNDALLLDPDFAAVRSVVGLDGLQPLVAVNEEGGRVQIAADWWYDHDATWIGCTSLGPIAGYRANHPNSSTSWTCPDHGWEDGAHYLPFLRSAHLMGARWTEDETAAHAEDIGRALAVLNVTVDLAPVLGVSDGTSAASALGDRTFADDPNRVAAWAAAFSRGIRSGSGGRVATIVKHFPGLGSVTANTDDDPARSPPLADLVRRDLVPYERSVDQYYEASGVMMSNAMVPGLTCPESDPACTVPATLAPNAYRLLRDAYGWDGLVMTDTLQTPAVLGEARAMAEAAVAAVDAGADMVLVKPASNDPSLDDHRQILSAVRDALLAWVEAAPEQRRPRIALSLARIEAAKATIASQPPR